MLSFREVHVNSTYPQATTPFVDPGFYRPPVPNYGSGSAPNPGTGNGDTADPGADTQALYFLASSQNAAPGQVVYATGPDSVAVADHTRPDPAVGIVTSRKSPEIVVVQTAGEVVLGLTGLSPGVDYFLGADGMLTPPPLGGVLFVQRIGMATTASRLYLQLDGHIIRQNTA